MPSVYTPTPLQLATVTLPSDGDARSAASVNAPLEALADGLLWAYTDIGLLQTTITTLHFPEPSLGAYPGTDWQATKPALDDLYWRQHSVAGAYVIGTYLEFPYPQLAASATWRLLNVKAYIAGNGAGGGPHVAKPDTLPRLSLARLNYTTTGNYNPGADATEPWVGVATYDAYHYLEVTAGVPGYECNYPHFAWLEGETGANSLPDALAVYVFAAEWERI